MDDHCIFGLFHSFFWNPLLYLVRCIGRISHLSCKPSLQIILHCAGGTQVHECLLSKVKSFRFCLGSTVVRTCQLICTLCIVFIVHECVLSSPYIAGPNHQQSWTFNRENSPENMKNKWLYAEELNNKNKLVNVCIMHCVCCSRMCSCIIFVFGSYGSEDSLVNACITRCVFVQLRFCWGWLTSSTLCNVKGLLCYGCIQGTLFS